jgi:tetratricopeptide (TPR) repeat protein
MHGLILATLLAAPPAQRAADNPLASYMDELAAAQRRWARMAELRVARKDVEAKVLAKPLPAIMAQDYGELEDALIAEAAWPTSETASWAGWAIRVKQPALAAELYRKAEPGGALTGDMRVEWFRACAQAGDLECVARLLPDVGDRYPWPRDRLRALAARTLTQSDALDTRADFYLRGGHPSPALALERWALRPLSAEDRIKRLKLLTEVLPWNGQRLAREALIADPETPADLFVGAIRTLAGFNAGPDQKLAYWSTLANDVRPSKEERSGALLQMGLIQHREGRFDEAVGLFRQVQSLKQTHAATAALQIGHVLLARGEYEAALNAYREAESEYGSSRKACALYEGISLEHLGRLHEALAEYAFVMFDAPLEWRRPLALHLVELYGAAGRLDVLQRTLDGLGDRRYRQTIPIRTLMIVHRLEKGADWNSLAAHLKDAQPMAGWPNGRGSAQGAAAHALARHCEETLPLLAPEDGERSRWVGYTRALCGGDTKTDEAKRAILARKVPDETFPDMEFPPVKAVDLPDPIVCAEHWPSNAQPGAYRPPCP